MKKTLLFTFSLLLTFSVAIAQDGINYQGAATDGNGDELTNQNITIRASVLSGSASGNLEWEETHSTTTDQFGLFNIVIGQGTNTTNGATALFDDMDWGSADHYLKIEMDATGGTNYSMIGTTQMMSVPYALYAKSAGIDSTMLANMIGSSVGGMGGGCDYSFPEGIGEPVLFDIGPWSSGVNYTVPSNKNLYITSFMSSYADAELQISTHTVYKGQGNRVPQTSSPRYGAPHLPIIASSSEVISSTHDYIISGFLVDKLVEPITIDLSANYTVPQGKKLIVLNFYTHQSSSLTVNSKILLSGYYNYFSNITGCNPPCHSSSLKMPIFLSGNMIISSSPGEVINGYLVDENYFANCGGGGGSSSSASAVDSAMVAGMIANAGGGGSFGDIITINSSVENQAASDGFLYGNYYCGGSSQSFIKIYCDTFSSNTTERGQIKSNPYGGNFDREDAFMIPIKKGEYFSFNTGGWNAYIIDSYFMPLLGGGSSTASSGLDSATVANMINNAILQQIGLGDYYQGGVVAYIFQPGDAAYVAGEVHGYQAHYDGTTLGWGCEGVITAIGVNNTSVGQGPVNTQQLVNTCTETNFAAKWCNDLVIGGNSDWFLPNVSELMLLGGEALSTFNLGVIQAWTSEEATTGLNGCTGGNTCCYPVDFANTFYTNGAGNTNIYQNRKMPGGGWVGGVNCSGWGSSPVIAFRQF